MAFQLKLNNKKSTIKAELTFEEQQKLQAQKRQTQQTLLLLVGLLILVAVIYFVIRPTWSQVTVLRQQIETNQQLLQRLNNKVADLEDAHAAYDEIESQIEIIDEAVSDYSDVPLATKLLEKIAAEVAQEGGNLAIDTITIKDMPTDTPESASDKQTVLNDEVVTIVVSMSGDYQAVREFVGKLKGLRHNFFVDQLVFAVNENLGTALNVTMGLKYYYYN